MAKKQVKPVVAIESPIDAAASEITSLWWARPNENGHVKTSVVAEIIRKHLSREAK